MKDAYYFSHDSNARNDQRLMKVRMKYGMEGYGIYFGIIELLRETEDYTLTFNDLESLSFDLRTDLNKVEDIITNYNLFVIKGSTMFYSKSLKKRLECMDRKKQKRIEAGRLGGIASSKVKQKLSIDKAQNKTKQKETKINNIKEREIKFKNQVFKFTHTKTGKPLYNKNLLEEFYLYWSEPNKSNTKMNYELKPTFDIGRRLATWVKNDFNNNIKNNIKNNISYKLDANGKFYIAYCSKCNISDFYKEEDLRPDSRCCNSELMPNKKEKQNEK